MDRAKEQYITTIGRQLLKEIFVQESSTNQAKDSRADMLAFPLEFEEKV